MPAQASTEAHFAESLLNPGKSAPAQVIGRNGVRSERRFNVYRNNVIYSLIEALGDNFPTVKLLVGDAFFEAVARIWVLENKPASPLLFEYGAGFPAFLDGFEPLKSLPYAGDIARVDEARRSAYYAANETVITIAELAELPEETLNAVRLRVHPALRLIVSDYPLLRLWYAAQGDGVASGLSGDARLETVMVTRPAFHVELRPVDRATHTFIQDLQSGTSLGEAADKADDPSFDLAQSLQILFSAGGVSTIDPGELNQ
ncbi:MAG: DNA-binding domain-containing protein [Pseudomonadota bacterium]